MIFTPVNYERANPYVYKLLLAIFYFDLLLGLCPAWQGSFILRFISYESFMKIWQLGSLFVTISFSFLILCIQKKVYNPPIFFTIYILHILFTTSIVLNGLKSGALAIVGIPLSYWVLYDTLKQYRFPPKHLKRAFYALLAWCIIPIFYYAVAPLDTKLLFMTGPEGQILTFGGFAQHRNFYGIFLGVAFICTLIWKMKPSLKTLLCVLLSIGLILSVCRTAILSIAITVTYIFLFHKKISIKKKIAFLCILFIMGTLVYFILTNSSLVTRDVSDNDDRIELWSGIIKIIEKNFFWGVGEEALYFSKGFPKGAPAHNFALATIASYGIFVFVTFSILLILIFRYSGFYFNAFLIYLISWGLTQPYFGCTLISIHILIPLFIGHLLDNNRDLIF
ncbi:O-antigen ligase family protein [Phocaeicola faecium]|uniref:O-antigen ligase family protein n=1 Tax=Phocaeicola faecium TaxID=2762213 RepID=A0ABR8V9B7_9BACT|nr:O-antigen ligase family protein [Phocaeicola faecium]MBD8001310.1 O-antigen ligase family protein [Phocaeicola faecium]